MTNINLEVHSDGDVAGAYDDDLLEGAPNQEVYQHDGENMWAYWRRRNAQRAVEKSKYGPWFTHDEHLMDAEERRPDHADYDPSTLFIPESEWKKFTPGMRRYWMSKSKNFDSVLFYRWARFFIVYYQDAAICSKHFDLIVPPRNAMHITGFPEQYLQQNIKTLVDKGYKVAICEQTETIEMMKKRLAQ